MNSRHAGPALTGRQQAVLAALQSVDMAPARDLRGEAAVTSRDATSALEELERFGLAVRVFNAFGPQTPWWWRAVKAPRSPGPPASITPGSVWDWGEPSHSRTWLEVLEAPGEHGTVRVHVKAGEHNAVACFLPAWMFDAFIWPRSRGTVTAWSAGFHCPVHGECTEEMVRTDKRCALCGSLLNRV